MDGIWIKFQLHPQYWNDCYLISSWKYTFCGTKLIPYMISTVWHMVPHIIQPLFALIIMFYVILIGRLLSTSERQRGRWGWLQWTSALIYGIIYVTPQPTCNLLSFASKAKWVKDKARQWDKLASAGEKWSHSMTNWHLQVKNDQSVFFKDYSRRQ